MGDQNQLLSISEYNNGNNIEEYQLGDQSGLFIVYSFKYNSNSKEVYKKDISNLKQCFKKLNYKVYIKEVVTRPDIVNSLEKLSKADFTKYHSLVVAILCNFGIEANLKTGDGEKIRTDDFLRPLSSVRCPKLVGKPKVFIFQTYNHVYDYTIEKTYPSETDYIFFYGVIEGNISHRSEIMNEGSWLIKYLVDNIDQLAKKEDLLTILTKTFTDINKKSFEHNIKYIYKKVPCLISTLIKRFYLIHRAENEILENNIEHSLNNNDLEINNYEENFASYLNEENDENQEDQSHDTTEPDNTERKILESDEKTCIDTIVAEESVKRSSLIVLLLPTVLMVLVVLFFICLFMKTSIHGLIEWSEIIRSFFESF